MLHLSRACSAHCRCTHDIQPQVQFPERPGALRRFLDALSSPEGGWNVTLFHYRCTGNRESYVMLGLQVPPEQDKAWRKVTKVLQDEFTFEELGGEERRVFNMFIQ
jgi:threonine dehydratase